MTAAVAEERMQTIYEAHSAALMRTLLNWTYGDRHVAEDLVQETMVRAWRNLDTLDADPAVLRPWLFTVARRIAIDKFRARGVRPAETEADALEQLPAPGEPFEQILDRDLIHDVLAGLSVAHRSALVHVYFLDQSVQEAAVVLGVPEGTVKSRLYHASRAVRAAWDQSVVGC